MLGHMQIQTVGNIPANLPQLQIPLMDLQLIKALFLPALLISIIGYVESISVASTFAIKTGDNIDANRELVALGMSNIGGGLSGAMPVTGGFSRSVVNVNAGARTPLAGFYTAVLIALLMTGPLFLLENLPKVTLAATIIIAVLGLIQPKKLLDTWRFSKTDFLLTVVTIVATLVFGVETGISSGIVLSVLLHLYATRKPHMAIVGRIAGTEHFRNVLRHDVETIPGIMGIRVDENMYFANAGFLKREILQHVESNPDIKHCILMLSSVSDIDSSGLEVLECLNQKLQKNQVCLHLSEVKGPVMDKLEKTHLLQALSGEIFLTHYQAVNSLASKLYNEKTALSTSSTPGQL